MESGWYTRLDAVEEVFIRWEAEVSLNKSWEEE